MTRKEAKTAGLSRYFTGKQCPAGHVSERMVSTRACCECARGKKHKWSAENPDKVNAQKRAYRDANLEKVKAWNLDNQKLHRESANIRNRRYAATHREELRINGMSWEAANPGKVLAKAAKRRASKARQMPVWADKLAIEAIYAKAATLRRNGMDVHVDHAVPLQGRNVSGLHVHYNLQIIDANANRRKANNFQGVN